MEVLTMYCNHLCASPPVWDELGNQVGVRYEPGRSDAMGGSAEDLEAREGS